MGKLTNYERMLVLLGVAEAGMPGGADAQIHVIGSILGLDDKQTMALLQEAERHGDLKRKGRPSPEAN